MNRRRGNRAFKAMAPLVMLAAGALAGSTHTINQATEPPPSTDSNVTSTTTTWQADPPPDTDPRVVSGAAFTVVLADPPPSTGSN